MKILIVEPSEIERQSAAHQLSEHEIVGVRAPWEVARELRQYRGGSPNGGGGLRSYKHGFDVVLTKLGFPLRLAEFRLGKDFDGDCTALGFLGDIVQPCGLAIGILALQCRVEHVSVIRSREQHNPCLEWAWFNGLIEEDEQQDKHLLNSTPFNMIDVWGDQDYTDFEGQKVTDWLKVFKETLALTEKRKLPRLAKPREPEHHGAGF